MGVRCGPTGTETIVEQQYNPSCESGQTGARGRLYRDSRVQYGQKRRESDKPNLPTETNAWNKQDNRVGSDESVLLVSAETGSRSIRQTLGEGSVCLSRRGKHVFICWRLIFSAQ